MPTTASVSSRAAQAIRQSVHPAVRRLSVEETDEVIVLSGSVRTYYLKQLAQETVMPLRGDRQLLNHVTVTQD